MAANIYRSYIEGATLPPYHGTQCYWIGDGSEMILVDCADGSPLACEQLEKAWLALQEPPIRGVFATHYHFDHCGGGDWAAQRWKAPLYLHPRDIALIAKDGAQSAWRPFPHAQMLVGTAMVRIIEAPGHTPGQVNFWVPQAGVLLAGDNILGNSTSVVAPPDGDLGDYLQTLTRLRELKPRVIGPGHGQVVRDPDSYIAYYIHHRQQRTGEILAVLRLTGPMTAMAITAEVYRGVLDEGQLWMGERMVMGHLVWLARQGLVVEEDGRYRGKADD